MKSSTAQLIFLACAIGTQARSLPSFITTDCPSVQEVTSSSITVDGYEVVRQTFTCLDGNFTTAVLSDVTSANAFHGRTLLESRSQAECTTPSAECQCGTAADCACFDNGSAPSTSDCTTLIGSTAVISSIEGPTFLVQPNIFEAITLNTCTLGFLNLASTVVEYCWDDLATSGNDVVGCFGEGFTSGFCLGDDQRYLTRLGLAA